MYTVKKYVDRGSRSEFYKLEQRGKGFKTFESKGEAEYAYRVQSELSTSTLAPKVHSEVGRVMISGKLSRWGYVTEIAKTLTKHGARCDCRECEEKIPAEYVREIECLVDSIGKMGYDFVDSHIGNVGYVKRSGKNVLVCIDTGEESVYDGDGGDYSEDYGDCSCYQCQRAREEQGEYA